MAVSRKTAEKIVELVEAAVQDSAAAPEALIKWRKDEPLGIIYTLARLELARQLVLLSFGARNPSALEAAAGIDRLSRTATLTNRILAGALGYKAACLLNSGVDCDVLLEAADKREGDGKSNSPAEAMADVEAAIRRLKDMDS